MDLWINDFKIFLKEKRLTLKTILLLIILLSFLITALFLIYEESTTVEYPIKYIYNAENI